MSIEQTHDKIAQADGWEIWRSAGLGTRGAAGFRWYLRGPDGKARGFDRKGDIPRWFVEAGRTEPKWCKA